jgi:hypothetical protein
MLTLTLVLFQDELEILAAPSLHSGSTAISAMELLLAVYQVPRYALVECGYGYGYGCGLAFGCV